MQRREFLAATGAALLFPKKLASGVPEPLEELPKIKSVVATIDQECEWIYGSVTFGGEPFRCIASTSTHRIGNQYRTQHFDGKGKLVKVIRGGRFVRFFEIDGKRYEVESCYKCRFSDDETVDWCLYPGLHYPLNPLPIAGVHELCPLREVEHNLPQPPFPPMTLMFDKGQRFVWVERFKGATERQNRNVDISVVFLSMEHLEETCRRFSEYFGVEFVSATFDDGRQHGWARFLVPPDWSPEKVGSPNLIPFVPQPDLSAEPKPDSE